MPSGGVNDACPCDTLYGLCKDGKKANVEEIVEATNASNLINLLKGTCSDAAHAAHQRGTCLHATIIGGTLDLLNYLSSGRPPLCKDIANEQDGYGNTAMHLAVRKNRVDLLKGLISLRNDVCYSRNNENETPLFVAVRLGLQKMVKALVDAEPNSVLELCGNKDILQGNKNVLHLAVELHQVHIVRLLTQHKRLDLKRIINHGAGLPRPPSIPISQGDQPAQGEHNSPHSKDEGEDTILGDTPLHIAARRKSLQMVGFLLDVEGVDKYAMNNQGFTPFDIAKEKTEYFERYRIIGKLSDYPTKHKPFMYNTPSPSPIKLAKANKIVDKHYRSRQNAEIVVAALLASMTFTAVFQVPGGFQTENKDGTVTGAPFPTLINFTSFKLFLICDCVAFFLSLFVVFMWQMSSEFTTGDKLLFMCINNMLVCYSFAFSAYGFMLAVYVVLEHKVKVFSWVVLFCMASIIFLGTIAAWCIGVAFFVMRARFNRLCGVFYVLDNAVEHLWLILERCGFLDRLRKYCDWFENFISGLWFDKFISRCQERESARTGVFCI